VSEDDADLQALSTALTAEFRAAAPTLVARVTEIPRTATGKPKRRELAERFSEV
jgi:acyl-coenzyme A synthetase/AMP-(fatty) acid ligase